MNKKHIIYLIIGFVILVLIIIKACLSINSAIYRLTPDKIITSYVKHINNGEYDQMYEMLDDSSKANINKEDFITRNKNIYSGIEAQNITVDDITFTENKDGTASVKYNTSMDTVAGNVSFYNTINLVKDKHKDYYISWNSNVIFPKLDDNEKIKVNTIIGERGSIYDRNGKLLAGKGTVSSVGFVPGKMNENPEEDIKTVAGLLGITEEKINSLLSASYVKDDTFVAITNVSKNNTILKDKLLKVPGIKITDATARVYPYGEELAHLIGYVQNVTKEDLEANPDKGYTSNSIIGKSGLEKIYEDRLRAKNGADIYIVDSSGKRIETVAKTDAKNGENIKLTIDAEIQQDVFKEFNGDEGCAVIINPKTGEVLAMCSVPSYDANEFVLGMSNSRWEELSKDEKKPMYIRYQGKYVPGSSFKPVTAAIALTLGSIKPEDDLGPSVTRWQKDSSWGTYHVTTLQKYSGPSNLANALIYSDNIYFAKVALKIGKSSLISKLKGIGFNTEIEVGQKMTASQYANENTFESEITLADTGYGQGELLVNPVHMASIYSSFVNNGSMIKPYIEYNDGKKQGWLIESAFDKNAANTIREDLIQVVENPHGTAYSAKINGLKLAGKTGTAEIKASKEDETGTEIGWFNAFIADEDSDKQLLIISMIENVKDRGGSHYLLNKVRNIFQKIT